jgi:type VII secretion integral membrane protein EccD
MATDLTSPPSTAVLPRRVTVVAPHTRVDLALPVQATVAEVVLQVVELVGAESDDPAGGAGGWLLSRLDGKPLEPGRSVVSTDIGDGDVLYLTPRSSRLPPALFDDVVDAIAKATSNRPDHWTTSTTRRTVLALAGLLAGSGVGGLAVAGPPWGGPVVIAVAATITLLLAATGLSRAAGDSVAGAVAGLAALPYAGWAGARAGASGTQSAQLVPDGASAVLVGAAALALACAVAAVAVGDHVPAFGAIALIGAGVAAAAAAAIVFDASAVSVAAVLAALSIMTLPWLPMLSVRLARLPLPTVPVDMAEFRRDEQPITGADMAGRARQGDAVLTALIAALAGTVTGCLIVLGGAGTSWPRWLAACLCLVLVLRSRQLLGHLQRLLLLAPGLAGLAGLAAGLIGGSGDLWQGATAPAALLVATAMFGYALSLPRRGAAPYAARLVDLIEFLALASLLPLVGAILGLYAKVRGWGG